MRRWSLPALLGTIGICVLVWFAIAMLCLMVGSRGVGWPASPEVFHIRREVVLLSSLVGAALAAAGVAYQAILRNPLADPYLLGVSSGAALFSYLWRLPALATLVATLGPTFTQQTSAFIGGLASISIVFALASRRARLEPLSLLLTGVIVNIINAALFLLINEIVQDQSQQASFLVGGLQDPSSAQFLTVSIVALVCFIALLLITPQLNVALLSEPEA